MSATGTPASGSVAPSGLRSIGGRARERPLARHGVEGVQRRIVRLDPGERLLGRSSIAVRLPLLTASRISRIVPTRLIR